jgi:SepF-like predicted cell division protein (DUF552 family)
VSNDLAYKVRDVKQLTESGRVLSVDWNELEEMAEGYDEVLKDIREQLVAEEYHNDVLYDKMCLIEDRLSQYEKGR